MRWNTPEYMLLLLIIPIAVLYKWSVIKSTKKGSVKYPITSLAITAKKSFRQRLSFLPDLLRFVALVLMVLALMKPQYGMELEETEKQGIDIMLVIDISGSMAAEDFKPNRMEAAKKLTEKFIIEMSDHRIGLVVFSGLAITQCPLTTDYGTLVELLRRTNFGMLKRDGTAIGDGITNAVYRLADESQDDTDKGKVIVLLTDGENNAGLVNPLDAAKIASEKKIKIYAIGMGTEEGAPVPIIQRGQRMLARNPDGSIHMATFDEQLLKDIAYITEGKYFRATQEKSLEDIYNHIASLEKGKIEIKRTVQYADRFYWFLAPAFALLTLELYLRSRIFHKVF